MRPVNGPLPQTTQKYFVSPAADVRTAAKSNQAKAILRAVNTMSGLKHAQFPCRNQTTNQAGATGNSSIEHGSRAPSGFPLAVAVCILTSNNQHRTPNIELSSDGHWTFGVRCSAFDVFKPSTS
jgi:hypothetical protein